MKNTVKVLLGLMLVLVLIACGDNSVDPDPNPDPEPDPAPMTIAEVIEQDDNAYVEAIGFVTGYDEGKRHLIIEDAQGGASIQVFQGLGFPQLRVGDEILIRGYRVYDRSTNRIAPESFEILSRDNETSYDNPIVIDGSELVQWTQDNRTNEDILFKVYQFNNVVIKSASSTYAFIDDQYDEAGGRGLKIGIKDTSFYPAEHFVVGQTYSFKAVLYGSSDDFFDEERDGTVLRLSVLTPDDVILHVEGEAALITTTGRRNFLTATAQKPDFTSYFNIVDATDGNITVTEDMIVENVDMDVPGTYEVTVTFTNSEGYVNVKTIEIIIADTGVSVTHLLNQEVGYEAIIDGVIAGYAVASNGNKQPVILEDPLTGYAIEIWTSNQFNNREVGDLVRITGTLGVEKGLPRLTNSSIVEVLEQNQPLAQPREITDFNDWSDGVLATPSTYFGRYTFTATATNVSSGGYRVYFSRQIEGADRIIQFAVHSASKISYDWEEGETYTLTGILYGVSDPIANLFDPDQTGNVTARFGLMNLDDIVLHVEPSDAADIEVLNDLVAELASEKPDFTQYFSIVDPVDGEVSVTSEMINESVDMQTPGVYDITLTFINSVGYENVLTVQFEVLPALTVTQVLDLEVGTTVLFDAVVAGYGLNGSNKRPIILEDPLTGYAIELWTTNQFNTVSIGDLVRVSGTVGREKGLPRLLNFNLIEILSHDNDLSAPKHIEDLMTWTQDILEDPNSYFGRYTFTATATNVSSGGYRVYFSRHVEGTDKIIQFAVHSESFVSYEWQEGVTYSVTGILYGISDNLSVLSSTNSTIPTTRFGIMDIADIVIVE